MKKKKGMNDNSRLDKAIDVLGSLARGKQGQESAIVRLEKAVRWMSHRN